jgi:hypothetical protein
MPNTTNTTYMDLTVPNLNQSGPAYASEINADLVIIDAHDHDGSQYGGRLINISGQIVGGDLSLDGYNLSNVRSVQFVNNTSTLVGSQDVNNVYASNGNLYYNNADGIAIQITAGNTLAPSTNGPATNWSIRGPITSNATILPTDTYNCLDIDTTGGPITIVLPVAAFITPNAIGRIYLFRMINFSNVNTITIQVAPGSGNVFGDSGLTAFVLPAAAGYVALYTDGSSKWFTFAQSVYNTEVLSLYNQSQLVVNNNSTISLTNGCELSLDNTSTLFVDGGNFNIVGSTTDFVNGTINMSGAQELLWKSAAIEHFETGTSLTMDLGTSIFLNGSLNGTTDNTGHFTINGALNLQGLTNITGTGTTLLGTMNVNHGGLISVLNSSSITTDSSSTITSNGTLNMVGVNIVPSGSVLTIQPSATINNEGYSTLGAVSYHPVIIPAGTVTPYTCDNGLTRDYYVQCMCSSGTAITVNLPNNNSALVNGRVIIINILGNAGYNLSENSTWSVTINPVNANLYNYASGGLLTTLTINTAGSVIPAGYIVSLAWIFIGTTWYPYSLTNLTP